jgi:hypothetical protein
MKKNTAKEFMHGAHYMENNICPICDKKFTPSEYLASVFPDQPLELFIANLITHYRHEHITSWNKAWGRYGSSYRQKWLTEYEDEKSKVNERAKRQIIRKALPVLQELGITSNTFSNLEGTTAETIALADKYFQKKNPKNLFSDEN